MAEADRIIPLLVYEDIAAAHDFLVGAFGFTSGGVVRDGEGRAVHAEVRVGELPIWLHRVMPESDLASPRALPAAASGLVVHVADVDAHFARAHARGARIDREPADMPYGQREYAARDPEGHRWWFATPVG
jgi:uncharacterized glyoxalase superfamily protein PhnB